MKYFLSARQLTFALLLVSAATSVQAVDLVSCFLGGECDFTFDLSGKFRPEVFWAKNANLFNDSICEDRQFYARHILDVTGDLTYGRMTFGSDILEFRTTVRNKGVWGNPESIARTTVSEIKVADALTSPHLHAIPRHILWIREIWMSVALDQLLSLSFKNNHVFKLGAFPFELGRGIALGDAYAVGPENLGFYTDEIIDQYAFGGLFTGDIITDRLTYDIYMAILNNRSTSFSETAAETQAQEYGRRDCPQRGYGKINYLIAGRLLWDVFNNDCLGKLTVQPYALFNDDREQRLEFLGDADSKIGTAGLAAEYYGKRFDLGFDYALNFGRQNVKGWDRNRIQIENNNGALVEVNSDVVDQHGNKIPFVPKSEAQTIIQNAVQEQSLNGTVIGVVDTAFGGLTPPVDITNSSRRFRDPNVNSLQGWMAVADGGCWVYKNDLYVAVGAGYASGDANPNIDTMDHSYSGFIGLQEVYSGKRVKSAFVLGGAGKIKRPIAAPTTNQAPSKFSFEVNRFTNLIYTGASLKFEPKGRKKKFAVNPNVLVYWQDYPSRKFDATTGKILNEDANNFLGVEINTFLDYYPIKNLRAFIVASMFIPGRHYQDIAGLPLNPRQEAILARYNRTGDNSAPVPNLGSDIAITFNGGFEYRF